jgi:hypothetical protein
MSYSVNNFNGQLLTTVNDGTIDTTTTSIKLLGKGITNYGETIAENFVHMLENFARTTAPSNPIVGQMWYHIDANGVGNHIMKVCKSISPVEWVVLGGVVTGSGSSTAAGFPANPADGDLFWDGDQLWAWDDSQTIWQLIGPMSTTIQNTNVSYSGDLVSDGTSWKNIIKVVVNGKIVAIFSDTPTPFTPNPSINDGTGDTTGFPTIYGGMTLHSDYRDSTPLAPLNASSQPTITNQYDFGSSTNKWRTLFAETVDTTSLKVSGSTVSISNFMRKDTTNTPSTHSLNIGSAANPWGTGYYKNLILQDDPSVSASVGDGIFQVPVGTTAQRPSAAGTGTIRYNTTLSAFEGKGGSGSWTSLGGVKDVNGDTYIIAETSAGANNDQLQFYAGGTKRLDVGTSTSTFYGEWKLGSGATLEATYADIAECYVSDMPLEPGDVIKIGGSEEITKTTVDMDDDVFGVVTTAPAFTLNSGNGVAVAIAGRVPCKIVGSVSKGQRLVASDIPGVARAITKNEAQNHQMCIIGRSLSHIVQSINEITLVEIVVGIGR